MSVSVCKTFSFDSAHYLPNYLGKCRNLHGHHWVLEVEVEGPVNPASGMVIDFARLKILVNNTVVDLLDHTCLNDLDQSFSENPTCENILMQIWARLVFAEDRPVSVSLKRLRLYETPDSYAEITSG